MMTVTSQRTRQLFIAFLIMQPILDVYIFFTDAVKRYTLISPATIIRIAVIALLVVMTLISTRISKRSVMIAGCIVIILIVYFMVHHLAVTKLPITLPTAYRYSIIDEINYFTRYLMMFLLMWVAFKLGLSEREMETVVTSLVLSICVTMIVTNLLHVSLVAYSEANIHSKYSFVSWFGGLWKRDPYIFNAMTSKGWFYKANPLSGVLTLLMPLNLAFYFSKGRFVHYLCVVLQILSAFMIGSRTAVLGCLLSLALVFSYSLLLSRTIGKQELLKRMSGFVAAILVFVVIYPYSPYANRPNFSQPSSGAATTQTSPQPAPKTTGTNEPMSAATTAVSATKSPTPATSASTASDATKSTTKTTQSTTASGATKSPTPSPQATVVFNDAKIAQITSELSQKRIPNAFHLAIYPVRADPEFWFNLTNMPITRFNDSRKLELLITERMMHRTGPLGLLYRMTGLGRSLLANGGLYIERDYLAQIYSIGWFGFALFVLPILTLFAFCIVQILTKRYLWSLNVLTLATSVGLILVVAYFSGHIIEELFPMLLCVSLLGLLLRTVRTSNAER